MLLISVQVQSRGGLSVFQAVAFGVFARVQGVLAAVADGGRATWSHYFALRGVARENEQLHAEVLQLQGLLQQAQAQARQAADLERALGLKQSVPVDVVVARVIAGGPSPGSLAVTIDRGTEDGVQAEMAVVAADGVVGRVINKPLPHAAQVQLLIDRAAHAGVYFEKANTGGILGGGNGNPPMRVEYVSPAATVAPGDKVFTSGIDSLYPRGYLVGTVESAEHRTGTWNISVRPAVDFSRISLVLVVRTKPAGPRGAGGGS